jgi:hypothetical protein
VRSAQLRRALYPDRIQALADYLCPRLKGPSTGHVGLRLWIECQYEPDAPAIAVTDGSRDYCKP